MISTFYSQAVITSATYVKKITANQQTAPCHY